MYMHKDVEGKIKAGPVWDMDVILNSTSPYRLSHIRFASKPWDVKGKQTNGILYQLCQRSDFHAICKELYDTEIGKIMHSYLDNGRIDSLYTLLHDEANRDNQLNHTRQSYNYDITKIELVRAIKERLCFLDWYYSIPQYSIVYLEVDSILGQSDARYHYQLCYQKEKPFETLQYASTFNNAQAPSFVWYMTDTDSILYDGMLLSNNCHVVCRHTSSPSWFSIQKRRVRTKFYKLFH